MNVLHSRRDIRYEWELNEHLLELSVIVAMDGLVINKRVVPKLLPELPKHITEYLRFHHAEKMCQLMARLLYAKHRVSIDKGYYQIQSEPWYRGGEADLGLVQGEEYQDVVTVIAVEVGEVYAHKPIEGFMDPHLRELWVYPYSREGELVHTYPREGDPFYIFKRGSYWQEIARRRHEQRIEQLKQRPSIWESPLNTGQRYNAS